MAEGSLQSLEQAAGSANEAFMNSSSALEAANARAEAARAAYSDAMMDSGSSYMPTPEQIERMGKAQEELNAANAELDKATQDFENKAQEAQDAADAVEQKKEELRASRADDTSYVVHTARIECSCGMRESYLVLGDTHGVYTRQMPQMTVGDCMMNDHVINFGGCTSAENPSTIAAAQAALDAANEAIEKEKASAPFRTWITSLFVKDDTPSELNAELISQCVGECIGQFLPNPGWLKGQEKVTINGEAPLLRRCDLTCIYGGCVTILLSGQPE